MADRSKWSARAEALLEQALGEVRDDIDAIPTVVEALAALRVEAGELDESEMDDEDDEPECICPADLVARGGYRGGCPVHAAGGP